MTTLADTSVWLALTLSRHVFHRAARSWLKRTKSDDKIVFCRATQQSFLRLLTTREVLARYDVRVLTNSEAWAAYANWLSDHRIAYSNEPQGLEANWQTLTARNTASPKLWMDAYLAAFAMSGGYQLVTTDKSFRQYKGLNVVLLSKT